MMLELFFVILPRELGEPIALFTLFGMLLSPLFSKKNRIILVVLLLWVFFMISWRSFIVSHLSGRYTEILLIPATIFEALFFLYFERINAILYRLTHNRFVFKIHLNRLLVLFAIAYGMFKILSFNSERINLLYLGNALHNFIPQSSEFDVFFTESKEMKRISYYSSLPFDKSRIYPSLYHEQDNTDMILKRAVSHWNLPDKSFLIARLDHEYLTSDSYYNLLSDHELTIKEQCRLFTSKKKNKCISLFELYDVNSGNNNIEICNDILSPLQPNLFPNCCFEEVIPKDEINNKIQQVISKHHDYHHDNSHLFPAAWGFRLEYPETNLSLNSSNALEGMYSLQVWSDNRAGQFFSPTIKPGDYFFSCFVKNQSFKKSYLYISSRHSSSLYFNDSFTWSFFLEPQTTYYINFEMLLPQYQNNTIKLAFQVDGNVLFDCMALKQKPSDDAL